MEEYQRFDRLARVALSHYKVLVGTWYGRRETCRSSGTNLFYVSVKGQGLPKEGFTIGCESAVEAVTSITSRLKRHQDERDAAAAAAHAAAYALHHPSPTTNS